MAEEGGVGGEGQAREVDFEEFGVARAVGGRVEDGVHVVEDVFWAKGLLEVAFAVGDELHLEFFGDVGDEGWREVGMTTTWKARSRLFLIE